MSLKPKSKITLDHLGQYYSTLNCKQNPGTFSLTVNLTEDLIPTILQQAVIDMMQRLPFLNVRCHKGFWQYYHVVLSDYPIIINGNDYPAMCKYFKQDYNHLIRVIFGKRYFTVEVLHSVCDGRSLALIVSSLLTRYFELLGDKVDKRGIIDCKETMHKEEIEDAYLRYSQLRSSKKEKINNGKINEVYVPKYQTTSPKFIIKNLDLNQIKSKAKYYNATITEYIMSSIFNEFSKQRDKDKDYKKITVNIPIDCRSFFPSSSLKNFVSNKAIVMPENSNLIETLANIKNQFNDITPDYILDKISEMEKISRIGRYMPLFIKNHIINSIKDDISSGYSTGLSNLGLIKLPDEIKNYVKSLSFNLGPETNMPYQFACVAFGNILTLTTTTTAQDTEIIERIVSTLVS